jgi:hypothetical protein
MRGGIDEPVSTFYQRILNCGAAVFAADGDALYEAQGNQQNRCAPTDSGESWQQTGQEGCGAHHMVTRNVYLRPMRSPTRPKIIAPNGRTRKPAA